MIDLCKIFGVEEGEEFGFRTRSSKYVIRDNRLFTKIVLESMQGLKQRK